jgi:predicted nucleic acid-binding protein
MFLLDTDVLSLTSPVSQITAHEAEAWREWVRNNSDALHISVITIMEIRFGLEKLRSKGTTRKSDLVQKWLLLSETVYRNRIIPVSTEIAHKAGKFLQNAFQRGVAPGAEDALIAASAEVMGLHLVSRNGRHMSALGVSCIDPLSKLPGPHAV